MRRLLVILTFCVALFILPAEVRAQSGLQATTFLSTASGLTIPNSGTGITFHKLTWNITGAPASCTVALDSSVDGVTWTAGGAIAGQTCTSNGSSAVTAGTFNFVRVTLTAFTTGAGNSVTATWTGYVNNPSGGGGGNSCGTPTCTVSASGSGNGVLALSGNISGTATFTAPAVAGTVTNPVVASNVIQFPAGNATNPSVAGSTNTNTGVNLPTTSSAVDVVAGGINAIRVVSASDRLNATVPLNWASGDPTTTSSDTGLSRSSPAVVAVGSGANGNSTGKMLAAAFQSGGTTFTSSGGCTEATLVGGATIGKFTTSGSTSCTTVITMGSSQTATNGWVCHAVDLTTAADAANPHQTATTTTTATIATGTIVAGDVIQFSCMAY